MVVNYAEKSSKVKKNPALVPQSQKLPGEKQVQNNAGGFVYKIDKWQQLNRFLIIGTEGGSYYVGENKLTKENAKNVLKCIEEDSLRVAQSAINVSVRGLAAKQDPTLFVLALCLVEGDKATKEYIYQEFSSFLRTGTMLFTFVNYVKTLGKGFGAGYRRAISRWYTEKDTDTLIYQVIKYGQRQGWTHGDLLRLSHPNSSLMPAEKRAQFDAVCKYALDKVVDETTPEKLVVTSKLPTMAENEIVDSVKKLRLPWEALPTQSLNSKAVWEALLEDMPMTAMIRNLAKMSSIGLLEMGSNAQNKIVDRLTNAEYVTKSRIHPINVLIGMKTYTAGRGFKGSLVWTPNARVSAAMEDAFYAAFKNVEPTNKRYLMGIDVSGSMSSQIMGSNVTSAEVAAAIGMVTYRTERHSEMFGFTSTFVNLNVTPKDSLKVVCEKVQKRNFGTTDCAQPMIYALQNNIETDVFIVITDNETWSGKSHPSVALRQYREKTGIDAKLLVLATSPSKFSIADPEDRGMLDIAGFDSSIPEVIRNFAVGNI